MPLDLTELRAAIDTHHGEVVERQAELANRLSDMEREVARALAFQPAPGGVRPNTAERQAFVNFIRSGVISESRAMVAGTGADGGYMVPREIDSVIATQLRERTELRKYASVVSVSTADYRRLVSKRGAAASWRGEADAVSDTATSALAEAVPSMGEIHAYPKVSQHLIDDAAFDVEQFILEDLLDLFAVKEGTAFVSGDGTNKPMGFLTASTPVATADASRAFGVLQFVKTGAAADFASTDPSDNLIDLMSALKPAYRGPDCAWMMNPTTASIIRKFKDGNDRYLWADSLAAGQPAMLLGYPVIESSDMPDIGANAFPVAFGNWKRGYLIADRVGISILRDPYTSPGHVKFFARKRVGGGLLDSNAIKLLKCAA